MTSDCYLDQVNERLDVFLGVGDDDLSESVVRHGSCMRLYALGDGPRLTGDPVMDRSVTAPVCAACPVRLECLEWEMRSVGADTQEPWGLLGESDRREFHEVWAAGRDVPVERPSGLWPEDFGGGR
jgi:WhiB family transcriptional regulator, redox-sensing transcriptional regulator